MDILVACEESQRVCSAFRSLGHNAFSCDIVDTSGSFPEYHIKDDVRNVLNDNWDMIIAFPPCTYLTVSGNRWFDIDKYGDSAFERFKLRENAIDFFMLFANCKCHRVAIENPIGIMSSYFRKPDQIIQPYFFGDPERKSTCLWLKNLPKLKPTNIVEPRIIGSDSAWYYETWCLPKSVRQCVRSKTFPGIAHAMAEQWSLPSEVQLSLFDFSL